MKTAIMQATMTIKVTARTAIMIVMPLVLVGEAALFALSCPPSFVVAPGFAVVVVLAISTNHW